MLENAIIVRAGSDRHVSIGVIAETLFFYRSTHLILNMGSVGALAERLPPSDLIELLDHTNAKVSYIHSNFGVLKTGLPPSYQFATFKFGGHAERKIRHYHEEIEIMLERKLGQSRDTKRLIKAINNKTHLHKFRTPEGDDLIPTLARHDAIDPNYIRTSAAVVLRHLVPNFEIPSNFTFELLDTGSGYAVYTNLDYASINRLYHLTVPPSHSTITSEYLLAHILTARADSYLAAEYMAEIVTAPIYCDLIKLKHFDFLRRREISRTNIAEFQSAVLPDFPTISDAIDSGEKTIADLLALLDKADRFRDWLACENPDGTLVNNYIRASTEKTWADKLPTKSLRFFVATGLGLVAEAMFASGVGAATGMAIGALDSLYLDKLVKGWRPNLFVEGPYTDFLHHKT